MQNYPNKFLTKFSKYCPKINKEIVEKFLKEFSKELPNEFAKTLTEDFPK